MRRLVVGVLSTAVVGVAVVAGAAAAAGTWTDVSPSVSPPGRYFAAMAAEGDGDVVLFGGNGASGPLADTWVWSGSAVESAARRRWAGNRSSGCVRDGRKRRCRPLRRAFATRSPDPPVFFDDTWIWNGTSWTEANPAVSPPARWAATMAAGRGNGQIVLFGGSGETTTWTTPGCGTARRGRRRHPATSPPAPQQRRPWRRTARATSCCSAALRTPRRTRHLDLGRRDLEPAPPRPRARRPSPVPRWRQTRDGNVVLFGGSGSTGFTVRHLAVGRLDLEPASTRRRAHPSGPTHSWRPTRAASSCCSAAAAHAGSGYADTWLLDVGAEPDADGDGIPDGTDACPISDLDPTVVIGGSDTGAGNDLLPDGCTVQDLVDRAAASAQTHGAFVSTVVTTVRTLHGRRRAHEARGCVDHRRSRQGAHPVAATTREESGRRRRSPPGRRDRVTLRRWRRTRPHGLLREAVAQLERIAETQEQLARDLERGADARHARADARARRRAAPLDKIERTQYG